MSIPKILFTYWSGDNLSWLHVLTLKTLLFFNKDFRVYLYTSDPSQTTSERPFLTNEHKIPLKNTYQFNVLKNIPGVEVIVLDLNSEFKTEKALYHTYVADLVRIKKLWDHGGVWFDMDILFLKSFSDFFLMMPESKEIFATSYFGHIATGLVGGVAQSDIVSKMLSEALSALQKEGLDYEKNYQAFGPHIWRTFIYPQSTPHNSVYLYDHTIVYPYLWNEMREYFYSSEETRVSEDTLGVHWYNGSHVAHAFLNEQASAKHASRTSAPIAKDLQQLRHLGCLDELETV